MTASNNTMKVACPNCKSILTIPHLQDIGGKMLSCPVCGFRAKVAVYMSSGISRHGDDDEPTQVNLGEIDRTIGSLYIGKVEYALKKGKNTIGRFAPKTGKADVQLKNADDTTDAYMSRHHADIDVKEGTNGLEHHLTPANAKNKVMVNGKPLENGDIVILQWGDILTFGHTSILFQRPSFYEEETMME